MPIKKSALKEMRADKKKRERNMRVINDLKTRIKRLKDLIAAKKADEARSLLLVVTSRIDKAVQKKIIHRNKASRTISRLSKKLSKI